MSDDLVKRAREAWKTGDDWEAMVLLRPTANRIEELEAKLAKAVDALQQLVIEYDEVDLAYDEPKSMTAAYGVALDTLAELTKERSDEKGETK